MHKTHELHVAARLALRNLKQRMAGKIETAPDRKAFLEQYSRWLHQLRESPLVATPQCDIPANQPPWFDSGVDLRAGESVTWLACGRVYLSRALDIWVASGFQLWARIGENGPVFSGTRNTHSFTASTSGRLYFASYFPGEWATKDGQLATDAKDYRSASGGIAVQLLRWQDGIAPAEGLAALAAQSDAPKALSEELARLAADNAVPADWRYLWFLGDAEIYQAQTDENDNASIHCRTHQDVGILQTPLELRLTPDTVINWDWRVDKLPSDIAEDTIPSHDYLSIAVEFDNGQDITWHWSAELPPETIYSCPLPTWKHRETHIVIRQGQAGLGEWHSESRNVYQDCIAALGVPADRVVKVWLIANSLFQRQEGRCEYRNIEVIAEGQAHQVNLGPSE